MTKSIHKAVSLFVCCSVCCLDSAGVVAAENPLSGMDLGVGIDRGFGLTGQFGRYSGFLGDDGLALDYQLMEQAITASIPIRFYIDAGLFVDWDGDFGVRAPVGLDLGVAPQVNVYLQVVPAFQVYDDSDVNVDLAAGIRYSF